MKDIQTRAEALRVRVFKIHGFGGVKQTADALDLSRGFMSRLLNGREDNESAMNRVEEYCEDMERQHAEAA